MTTTNRDRPSSKQYMGQQEAESLNNGAPSSNNLAPTKPHPIICKFISNNQDNYSDDDYVRRKYRTRYNVALLGLAIAVANCYAQATFCISIVEMVLPADYIHPHSAKLANGSNSTMPSQIANQQNSCPIEYKYKDYYDSWRFSSEPEATSNTQQRQERSSLIDISNRFDWDASQQGLLLGAFAVGMSPLQIVGGRLAEIYGAKWVLLAACVGTTLTNLTIPFLAHFSFKLLILNRVIMGITQAGVEPGLMCLLAQWLTPDETGLYISMLLFAICIGFFLGSLGSSFLLTIGYSWSLTYYVSAFLNLFICVAWLLYASSKPEESKVIHKRELDYIMREQRKREELENYGALDTAMGEFEGSAPWLNIISSRAVWAFMICKISIRWSADVVGLELPTYLANVLHLSIKLNGILNSVSSSLFAIFSFITGYLVNSLIQYQEGLSKTQGSGMGELSKARRFLLSKTNLRKFWQSLASFGSALSIFLMTRYDCNIIFSMSMLLILSCILVLGTGGELQIPFDMTSKYPGTLHGMACSLSVSGWLAPPLIGLILGDQPSSRERWNIVWYLTALINLIGGVVFVLFADASPRDFDSPRGSKQRENNVIEANDSARPNKVVAIDNASAASKDGNWSPLFDKRLIRIRQPEDSFSIRPSIVTTINYDSQIIDQADIIHPYREEAPEVRSWSFLAGSLFWRKSRRRQQAKDLSKNKSSETVLSGLTQSSASNSSLSSVASAATKTVQISTLSTASGMSHCQEIEKKRTTHL